MENNFYAKGLYANGDEFFLDGYEEIQDLVKEVESYKEELKQDTIEYYTHGDDKLIKDIGVCNVN
jgi:hypothetical protein